MIYFYKCPYKLMTSFLYVLILNTQTFISYVYSVSVLNQFCSDVTKYIFLPYGKIVILFLQFFDEMDIFCWFYFSASDAIKGEGLQKVQTGFKVHHKKLHLQPLFSFQSHFCPFLHFIFIISLPFPSCFHLFLLSENTIQ